MQLQGLGGKKIAKLHKELHVNDVNDLKIACEEGRVAALAGFGKKTEEKILSAIAEAGSRPDRLPLAFMRPIADDIETALANMEDIIRSSRAGSIRRMRETIKDLDFIISTDHPEEVKNQLLALKGHKTGDCGR